jgi:hypothetical protein
MIHAIQIQRTREEPRGCSPEGGRRRGPGALEVHGEMAMVVFGGNEVLDGIQESTARLVVWSLVSRVSCNGDGAQLELDVLAGKLWTRRRSASRRGFGKRRSYQRFRRTRQSLWRDLMSRGARSLRQSLVGVLSGRR